MTNLITEGSGSYFYNLHKLLNLKVLVVKIFVLGLVAIHGGVGLYHGWAAWVVGLVAGALYFITSQLLALCRYKLV